MLPKLQQQQQQQKMYGQFVQNKMMVEQKKNCLIVQVSFIIIIIIRYSPVLTVIENLCFFCVKYIIDIIDNQIFFIFSIQTLFHHQKFENCFDD